MASGVGMGEAVPADTVAKVLSRSSIRCLVITVYLSLVARAQSRSASMYSDIFDCTVTTGSAVAWLHGWICLHPLISEREGVC